MSGALLQSFPLPSGVVGQTMNYAQAIRLDQAPGFPMLMNTKIPAINGGHHRQEWQESELLGVEIPAFEVSSAGFDYSC